MLPAVLIVALAGLGAARPTPARAAVIGRSLAGRPIELDRLGETQRTAGRSSS